MLSIENHFSTLSTAKNLLSSKLRAAFLTSGNWDIGTASYRVATHRASQVIVIVVLGSPCIKVSEFPVVVGNEFVFRKWLYWVIIIVIIIKIKHVIAPYWNIGKTLSVKSENVVRLYNFVLDIISSQTAKYWLNMNKAPCLSFPVDPVNFVKCNRLKVSARVVWIMDGKSLFGLLCNNANAVIRVNALLSRIGFIYFRVFCSLGHHRRLNEPIGYPGKKTFVFRKIWRCFLKYRYSFACSC